MSKLKVLFGLVVLIAISVTACKGLNDRSGDQSVVPQSDWTDSENLFPLLPDVKWSFPGLGELLNVYAMTWMDFEEGDFEILKVEGSFPNARYFSLSLHTADMRTETYRLRDDEIVADQGYINPFIPGNERLRGQKYTIYFVKEGVKVDPSLKNVLYVPSYFKDVAIVTRQYRADDDTPLDQVAKPYPVITALHKDMTPGIAPPATDLPNGAMDLLNFEAFEAAYDDHQAFQVNIGNPNSVDFLPYAGDALGPSKDNRYLMATLGGDFSKVAVIGIPKPPTYENTRYGGPFVGGKNVRYWSFCHAEGSMGMVNDCINDDRIKPNSDGSITLVIGPESIKSDVEKAGLTWLPWTRNRALYKPLMGLTLYRTNKTYKPERVGKKTMLVFRQVDADANWENSIYNRATRYFEMFKGMKPFDPRSDESAEVLLGDYGPRGFVLDVDTFRKVLERGDFNKAFGSNYNLTAATPY